MEHSQGANASLEPKCEKCGSTKVTKLGRIGTLVAGRRDTDLPERFHCDECDHEFSRPT